MSKAKEKKPSKFKLVEENAQNLPKGVEKDLEWEGEELQTMAKTGLDDDRGWGKAVILRFFEFGVNVAAFKRGKPTAQQLFDNHRKEIEHTLWLDNLTPFEEVEPRLMFSKNKKFYRFIIACLPRDQVSAQAHAKTLIELANDRT